MLALLGTLDEHAASSARLVGHLHARALEIVACDRQCARVGTLAGEAHAARQQARLPRLADLRQEQVARVARALRGR